MRRNLTLGIIASAAVALFTTPASAGRTVIDSDPPITYSGYCDFNGDECIPASGMQQRQLGFSVDFGGGPTSSFIVYGNGLISFGDTPNNYSASGDRFQNTRLRNFGGQVVSGGIFNKIITDYYGQSVFQATPFIFKNDASGLFVEIDNCVNGRCFRSSYLDITPVISSDQSDGSGFNGYLHVRVPVGPQQQIDLPITRDNGSVGSFVNGFYNDLYTTNQRIEDFNPYGFFGGAYFFDIRANIGPSSASTAAVPEPSTWATMLIGFGLIGLTLRRKRHMTPAAA